METKQAEIEHRIQEEAFIMRNQYGKEKAIEKCNEYIKSWRKDICDIPYYDKDKVDSYEKHMFEWMRIAKCIRDNY